MGNDGGSIPTRRELVKEAAREKTTSEIWDASQQNSSYHWTYCPLSKRPLASPVVSDSVGRLFNKDSILEWLLEPDAFGDGAQVLKVGGVAGLKDIVDVKFEIAGGGAKSSSAERNGNGNNSNGAVNGTKDARAESWVCPVSRKELGPGSKAVYLVPCGHAFAQAVISEIKEDKCLVCSEPFEASNVIPINTTQKSELDRLKARIEKLSAEGLSHSLKKASSKKRKKDKEKKNSATTAENGTKESSSSSSNGATVAAGKASETNSKSAIGNAATASITSKVLAEQESSKRRKVESDNVKSLFTSSTVSKDANGAGKQSANRDFMSRGYTIPSKSNNR